MPRFIVRSFLTTLITFAAFCWGIAPAIGADWSAILNEQKTPDAVVTRENIKQVLDAQISGGLGSFLQGYRLSSDEVSALNAPDTSRTVAKGIASLIDAMPNPQMNADAVMLLVFDVRRWLYLCRSNLMNTTDATEYFLRRDKRFRAGFSAVRTKESEALSAKLVEKLKKSTLDVSAAWAKRVSSGEIRCPLKRETVSGMGILGHEILESELESHLTLQATNNVISSRAAIFLMEVEYMAISRFYPPEWTKMVNFDTLEAADLKKLENEISALITEKRSALKDPAKVPGADKNLDKIFIGSVLPRLSAIENTFSNGTIKFAFSGIGEWRPAPSSAVKPLDLTSQELSEMMERSLRQFIGLKVNSK